MQPLETKNNASYCIHNDYDSYERQVNEIKCSHLIMSYVFDNIPQIQNVNS